MAVIDLLRISNYAPFQRRGMFECVTHLADGAVVASAVPRELSIRPAGGDASTARRLQWWPMGPRYGPDNSYRTLQINGIVDMPAGTPGTTPYANYAEQFFEVHDEAALPDAFELHTPHPEVTAGMFPGPNGGIDIGFNIDNGIFRFGDGGQQWANAQELEPDWRSEAYGEEEFFGAINRKFKSYGRLVPPGGGAPPNANPSFGAHFWWEVPHDLPFVYFNSFWENAGVRDNDDKWRADPEYRFTHGVNFFCQGEGLEPRLREEEFFCPESGVPAHILNRRTTSSVGEETLTTYRLYDIRDYPAPANIHQRDRNAFGSGGWDMGVLLFTNNPRNQLEADSISAERHSPLGAVSQSAALRGEFGASRKVFIPPESPQMVAHGGRTTAARHTQNDIYNRYMNDSYGRRIGGQDFTFHRRGEDRTAPIQGNLMGKSTSGPHPGFGMVKCLDLITGVSNDFRALRISMRLNYRTRPIWHVDPNTGEPADYFSGFYASTDPQITSRAFFYQFQAFHDNLAGQAPASPVPLGARDHGVWGFVEPWMLPNDWVFGNGRMESLGHSHHESQYLTTFALLTGNIFARTFACKHLAEKFLTIYARSNDERNYIFARTQNDTFVGWGQTRMEPRGLRTLLNYYCVTGDERYREAVAQRVRDHYTNRWGIARYPGKPHQVFRLENMRDGRVAGFQDTPGTQPADMGVNAFQSSALFIPGAWCCLLWVEIQCNPAPDPYFDPDGRTGQAWPDAVQALEPGLRIFTKSALLYQLRDNGDGTYAQPHKMCYQATADPASRGDIIPNEDRNEDLDHAIIGPLGTRYRHWYGAGGVSYAGWPSLVVIGWLLGSRGNTPIHRELRQLAFDRKGFRSDLNGHTIGRDRGWGGPSGTDTLHRTAGFEDPYADWQIAPDRRYQVTLTDGIEFAATPSLVLDVSAVVEVTGRCQAQRPSLDGIVDAAAVLQVSAGIVAVQPRVTRVIDVSAVVEITGRCQAQRPRVTGPVSVSAVIQVSAGVVVDRPRTNGPVDVSAVIETGIEFSVLRPTKAANVDVAAVIEASTQLHAASPRIVGRPVDVAAVLELTGHAQVDRPRIGGPVDVGAVIEASATAQAERPRVTGPVNVSAVIVLSATAQATRPRVLQVVDVGAVLDVIGRFDVLAPRVPRIRPPEPSRRTGYTGDEWRPELPRPAESVRSGTVVVPSAREGSVVLPS